MIDRTPETSNLVDKTEGSACHLPFRARVVSEDDDDFFLDEIYVDDYAYRRQQARRPDHPEQAYMAFYE